MAALTRKSQDTVPKEIGEALGIELGAEVG